jgi:phosphoribosylglycinamide formyltransferase 1
MSTSGVRMPVVALVSGRGSNLRAIAERARAGDPPVEIRAVVSDREDAPALEWARAFGLDCATLPPKSFPDRDRYDETLAALVAGYEPELVILAGFMRILGPAFVDRFSGRCLNIHPSLLPRHRGLHTHRRVLEAGEREHGASVHFVTRELDGGPVVLQARVPVRDDDDEASLAARVLAQEHRIYPQAVAWFATGRLRFADGAAWLDGTRLDRPMVVEALLEDAE